jgi:hypothetical protein
MIFYDVELIDVSESVENFKFHKIKKQDLDKILTFFKEDKPYLEFSSEEGAVVLKTGHIRGIMYKEYEEKEKTLVQENIEASKEISKVKLKKTIFNSTGDLQ